VVTTNLSLVIPAFNEGNRLASGLQQLMERVSPEDTEILVVDDGSTDNTAALARSHLSSWPQSSVVTLSRNCGKGAAVKAGVMRARGDVIAYIDADMAADPDDLPSLLRALDTSDVAVGSRGHKASIVEKRGARRAVMNRTFGMVVASMTQLPYMDTQCGFKAFKGSIAKLLFHGIRMERFAFDVEVLDLAAKLGLQIDEVPVRWSDITGSHIRPMRDGMQMLGDLTRMRMTRKIRPRVQGVLLRDVPIESAGALLEPCTRRADLIVKWDQGTAVFLPCLPDDVAEQVSKRLISVFESYDPEALSVEFGSLLAPMLATDVRVVAGVRRDEATAIDRATPTVSAPAF
jgi:hypothetical protein